MNIDTLLLFITCRCGITHAVDVLWYYIDLRNGTVGTKDSLVVDFVQNNSEEEPTHFHDQSETVDVMATATPT